MLAEDKSLQLFNLAGQYLSTAKIRKVDIAPDEIFYCHILSLLQTTAKIIGKIFADYLKEAELSGYSKEESCKAFMVMAKDVIFRNLRLPLERVLQEPINKEEEK